MEILNLVLIIACIFSILANCLMAHQYGIVRKIIKRIKSLPPKEYQEYMTSPYIGFTSFFRAVKYPNIVDICIVGDSMTERGDLRYFFPDKTVVSQGIGGDTTRGMLNRLDCVIRCNPKIIVLQVGINDLLQNISIDNIMTNIGKIVSQLSDELVSTNIFIESVYPITR